MQYDEEARLWKPSRRSFFFMGASAAVGVMLPTPPIPFMSATERMMRMNFVLLKQEHAAALERAIRHGVRPYIVTPRSLHFKPHHFEP